MPLPLLLDNFDTLSIFMRTQLGIRLVGDAELHLAAGHALRIHDQVPAATLSTAISASALSAADQAAITARIAKRKMTK